MPDLPALSIIPVTHSLHGPLLERTVPEWLRHATPQRRETLKHSTAPLPDAYRQASADQRKALGDSVVASVTAQTGLDTAMAGLQGIDAFAAPLLVNALQDLFNRAPDVHTTYLLLKKPLEVSVFGIDVGSFEVLRLPLLQAALHNFEAAEAEPGAFHASSGFLAETAPGEFSDANLALSVAQFTTLCRTLDIGAKYQAYLNDFLQAKGSVADQALQAKFAQAQKTALRAAAELALLQKDIQPDDYRMILALIAGDMHPSVAGKPVWFRDLGLMKHRMTGCIVFSICEKYRYSDDLILYIPNEPNHPLKRYTYSQMQAWFKHQFTTRAADAGSPTGYQRFFSQFVAYADRPDYFSQLTTEAPAASVGDALAPYVPLANELLKGVNPFSAITGIKALPPGTPAPRAANPDPFLNPVGLTRKGHGIWAANINLWQYLYEQHRDKLFADARSHAVPTADVDARVRSEKLARLLNIGLLLLNTVSMFVPVLGEVMMGVMAAQLLEETFAGVVEWSEGDRRKAKAHLVDVAENLAFLAVMAGVGKGLGRLAAVKAEPLIESLDPVTLPDGQTRLWKPDLSAYQSPVILPADAAPTALGQYLHGGKTYIRLSGTLYENTFDPALKRWRIKHPGDPHAYQPPLSHNGAGAWRHTLEHPQAWDRLTLMRRLGPLAERFGDEQLLQIADISGTGDDVLRRMHLDNAPPPPELLDTVRLFKAEQEVAQVIEQVEREYGLDERYLYSLPLVAEMPRWPAGRVLEVIDAMGPKGAPLRYGDEHLYLGVKVRPAIRVSRADVLGGQLPTRILAALDEPEIVGLLGGESARVRERRPEEFRKQLGDYARTRQPALFESLYQGTEPLRPAVAKLRRLYPGLSEPAAEAVLGHADAEQLARFHSSGRVPLSMQEQARGYVQRGRLGHAYAGLHMDNMASADSKRLALHTLAKLPGWSDTLRLEVRDAHVDGPLLDAIGDPQARRRKYLVKRGPMYQAFNERGEALNSLPRAGDNFFVSLMHALPDEARQALGVPQVSQAEALRRDIIAQAREHRLESAHLLAPGPRAQRGFKPPQRISATRTGYPASGRGEGLMLSLQTRVQDVYPDLTDGQANGFILRQMLSGLEEQQIFSLLQNRLREWQTLEADLDAWVTDEPLPRPNDFWSQAGLKRNAAHALKRSWRQSPLAQRQDAATLNLICDQPLPALGADFSHVRSLTLGGRGITDSNVEQVLGYFPNLEAVSLVINHQQLRNVPEAFGNLHALKHLTLTTHFAFEASQAARLQQLTRLQSLHLDGALPAPFVLDVSHLKALHSLKISGAYQPMLPVGVLELPSLERLDLRGAGVDKLPPQMLAPGHERLWAGLSLDWSRFRREDFKLAYNYLTRQPAHLMDLEEMVSSYCRGELNRLASRGRLGDNSLQHEFLLKWQGHQARFAAIESLSGEAEQLNQALAEWVGPPLAQDSATLGKATLAMVLRECWRNGVFHRHGLTSGESSLGRLLGYESEVSLLHVANVQLGNFPDLPATRFTHVKTLRLPGLQAPGEPLRAFIRVFGGVENLDLSGGGLTELPLRAGDLPQLKHLSLRNNPVTGVDVSGMGSLQSLDLSGTALTAWPNGLEQLSQLTWLDLSHTAIHAIPGEALSRDELLLSTQLSGLPLTMAARAELSAARQRIAKTRGLLPGSLERFAEEPLPVQFPPLESGPSIARRLLPLPPLEAAVTVEQRLLRLYPALEPHESLAWLAELRSQGLTDVQLRARLRGWEQDFDALTRRLNDWLYTRETLGQGWLISSQTRHLGAQRLLECWRIGLRSAASPVAMELTLHGLQLGDLPDLPVPFAHVGSLTLTGVRISGQGSNGFLRAFTRLRSLDLSSNPLRDVPEPVQRMAGLRRLELSNIGFSDAEALRTALLGLDQLEWLDLSRNELDNMRVDGFSNVHTLNLSSNRLTAMPEGVLQLPQLRQLDLSNNEITEIPPQVLNGDHERLLAGTDLSGNYELSRATLEHLRDYADEFGSDRVAGLSRRRLTDLIDGFDTRDDSDNSDGGVQPDEVIPPAQPGDDGSANWMATLAPDVVGEHLALWQQLHAEPGSKEFFHLLSRLQDTDEFRLVPADLRRRVWSVLQAAGSDTELRQLLFRLSDTHGTCKDGRILTFSNLEVKVFQHNALLGIDAARLDLKGMALLKLSRQLFRLDQVEQLANRALRPHSDAAEVRLEYRIGLTGALDLPGQPQHMGFGRPISGTVLGDAYDAVMKAEQSEAFYEDLIKRDHWVDYLREKYPARFSAQDKRDAEALDRLEGEHADLQETYHQAANRLYIDQQTARNLLLLELSRLETGEPRPAIPDTQQPGTSRNLMGN